MQVLLQRSAETVDIVLKATDDKVVSFQHSTEVCLEAGHLLCPCDHPIAHSLDDFLPYPRVASSTCYRAWVTLIARGPILTQHGQIKASNREHELESNRQCRLRVI